MGNTYYMARRKKQIVNTFYEPYVLPSSNSDMMRFIESYRVDMSEQVISSIAYALDNNLPMVEVFQFKNSEFVVTLSEAHFKEHLDHILDYYKGNERYELCSRVMKLQSKLTEATNNETKKTAGPTRSAAKSNPSSGNDSNQCGKA
jgi:hypothetical protein